MLLFQWVQQLKGCQGGRHTSLLCISDSNWAYMTYRLPRHYNKKKKKSDNGPPLQSRLFINFLTLGQSWASAQAFLSHRVTWGHRRVQWPCCTWLVAFHSKSWDQTWKSLLWHLQAILFLELLWWSWRLSVKVQVKKTKLCIVSAWFCNITLTYQECFIIPTQIIPWLWPIMLLWFIDLSKLVSTVISILRTFIIAHLMLKLNPHGVIKFNIILFKLIIPSEVD